MKLKLPRFDKAAKPTPALQTAAPAHPEDVMRMERKNDPALGVRHEHDWRVQELLPRLQSAHDSMRWDVSKSRILSVRSCAICNSYERESVVDCAVIECHDHKICERPYR
jgi:hypothetical protein